jgi:hypothetical protein
MTDILNDFATRQNKKVPHWEPRTVDPNWIAIKGVESVLRIYRAIRDIRSSTDRIGTGGRVGGFAR